MTRKFKKVNYSQIKDKLIDKYGCTCAYCKVNFFDKSALGLDNYYPRSIYPEKIDDEKNYVLACHICNRVKSAKSPISKDGKKNILHPYEDDYTMHMHLEGRGLLVPDTQEGESTIQLLNLNREALCIYRDSNPMSWTVKRSDKEDPKKNYQKTIKYIEDILKLASVATTVEVKEYLFKMLYSNIITAMETYLSSTIDRLLCLNEKLKWQFVEKYNWGTRNFPLCEIRKQYDEIDVCIRSELGELLYHNLGKIKIVYKNTLNIDILPQQEDMGALCKAVVIRHDIVHRNGKSSKKCSSCKIEEKDIRNLIKLVNGMTDNINNQIKDNNYSF